MAASLEPPVAELSPRERILRTAHDLFYREGIRATGIDRVIAESGVAKLTFYRQFASKNALVEAYLQLRHERWMAWFNDALLRHGASVQAIVPALREWFSSPGYRGCAFVNSVGELGPTQPEVVAAARAHKRDMAQAIAALLPAAAGRASRARAIALAIDGAIVQAQYQESSAPALEALRLLLAALEGADGERPRTSKA